MGIYLDHAATSPMNEEVISAYAEALRLVGNPSSVHSAGQAARAMLEDARERIARLVNCDRNEVVFTSGGTESNNLAINGLFLKRPGNLIISAYTEHHAAIDPIEHLVKNGAEVHWLSVDANGVWDLDELEHLLAQRSNDVALISLMWVNNETGVLNPIHRVCELAAIYDIPVHSDAVAAFGHTETDFARTGLATMAFAAHKVGGPIGIGALIVGRKVTLEPLLHGGGQERGLRAGTMNAPAAHAFAVAAEAPAFDYEPLATQLIQGIGDLGKLIRGDAKGVANIVSFVFPGSAGDSMLFLLDQQNIEVSNGSACTAGVTRASHVLLAMGMSEADAASALRFSFGPNTTSGEISQLLAVLPEVVSRARKI